MGYGRDSHGTGGRPHHTYTSVLSRARATLVEPRPLEGIKKRDDNPSMIYNFQ